MKNRDRINVRLDESQIKLIEEATKLLGNKMKESHVIRAAIDHYFSCPTSVLPNGKALPRIASIEVKAPELHEVKSPKAKRPKKNFTPSPDIVAGASTETKKRINPKADKKSA